MSSSSALYFQLHQTAEAFIRSYKADESDEALDALSRTLAPDCAHYVCPTSIHEAIPATTSPMSNTAIRERAGSVFKFLKSYKVEAKDITVDEIQRKAVVQAVHHVTMKPQFGDDNCTLEAMLTLWMSEDGTSIKKVHHFVDSLAAAKFFEDQQWVSRRPEERDPG
jgi:hypothetical protein